MADTVALVTAGLVSFCDPLVNIEGKKFPSVFAASGNEEQMGRSNSLSIANSCGHFSGTYVELLGKSFNCPGNGDAAVNHLVNCFNSMSGATTPDRHVQYPVVAPYFSIEPSCLFKTSPGGLAFDQGFASVAMVDSWCEKPLFPGVQDSGFEGGFNSVVSFEMRSSRTVAGLMFLNGHLNDGLANIRPIRFDSSRVALKGGDLSPSDARTNGEDMSEYLWGRGQSGLCAPAECIYSGSRFGVMLTHAVSEEPFMNVVPTHMFRRDELSGSVSLISTRPTRVGDGPLGSFPQRIRRERDNGVAALVAARQMVAYSGKTGGEVVVPGDSELQVQLDSGPNYTYNEGRSSGSSPDQPPLSGRSAPVRKVIVDGALHPTTIRIGPGQLMSQGGGGSLPVSGHMTDRDADLIGDDNLLVGVGADTVQVPDVENHDYGSGHTEPPVVHP